MIDIKSIKEGDKVHSRIEDNDPYELCIFKEVIENSNFAKVVIYCDNDWADYQNYPPVVRYINNLHLGWNVDED